MHIPGNGPISVSCHHSPWEGDGENVVLSPVVSDVIQLYQGRVKNKSDVLVELIHCYISPFVLTSLFDVSGSLFIGVLTQRRHSIWTEEEFEQLYWCVFV